RLVADINTDKIRGGIQLIDSKRQKADLIVPPRVGVGYEIAGVKNGHVIVREFLNHWEEDREKTHWVTFTPACFDLDLDSMAKRSVVCNEAVNP
ncbi:MAG TPA: hypothetical protein VMU17_06385, partial [Elusimicrobiota bacterium]|nr:hypothetical protein [Elusimicrobiota bacterium]